MKLSTLIKVNALLLIAMGIGFALYGPLLINFFGVQEVPDASGEMYWFAASFARLFGAALFGFGFLLWSIHSFAVNGLEAGSRRKVIFAMLLANLVGLFVAGTQQFVVWLKPAGLALVILFTVFSAGYFYLLAVESRREQNIP